MDEPSAIRELKAHQDPSCLMRAARAIMQLQMIYGLVPRIAGKGRAAEVCVSVFNSEPLDSPCSHLTLCPLISLRLSSLHLPLFSPPS